MLKNSNQALFCILERYFILFLGSLIFFCEEQTKKKVV